VSPRIWCLAILSWGCPSSRARVADAPIRDGDPAGAEDVYADCVVSFSYDYRVDGLPESTRAIHYDGLGRIDRIEIDDLGDGTRDADHWYHYGPQGEMFMSERETDRTYSVAQFGFDDGLGDRPMALEISSNTAFEPLLRATFGYTGERLDSIDIDDDYDDIVDHVEEYRYARADTIVDLDLGYDGVVDETRAITFDGALETREEFSSPDRGVFRTAEHTYDAWKKRTLTTKLRFYTDGSLKDVTVARFFYDDGRLTGSDIDVDDDGTLDATTSFRYQCPGGG
jgi:hypothetical protein